MLRERAAAAQGAVDLAAKKKSASLVSSKQAGSSVAGSSNTAPLKLMGPSPEQCNEQWMRAPVKNGLPMSLADDLEFRAAITMSARCGLTYMDGQKGDSKMPHRTFMMEKVLPALDAKLDAKVSKKIDGLIKETGACIISDGWTSCQRRPIINAIVSTVAGS